MENKYLVGKPDIFNKPRFLELVADILDTHIYSNNGPYCTVYEDIIQEFLGVDHCVVFTNATLALEAVFSYIKSKVVFGNVLVPSYTFIASVNSIVRAGLEPVFVDVDSNYCMDLTDAVCKTSSSTVAALPCNLFGSQASLKFQEYNYCVYDSAHAFNIFNVDKRKMIGSFGFCEVFSMHPTKLMGGIELGFVTTKSDELANYLRRYRNFGFETAANNPHGSLSTLIGTNAKANEISCAAAIAQIEEYEQIQSHYFDNYAHYINYLPDWIELVKPNMEFSNFSYIVCRYIGRDRLLEHLLDNGVYARKYFEPIHKSKPYVKTHGHYQLPMTDKLAETTFCLPTGLTIKGEKDVSDICNIIKSYRG